MTRFKSENFLIAAMIVAAMLFGFACRLYYVAAFEGAGEMRFNGQLMINTNDGYWWAEGARDLIENPPFADELSPKDRALPRLTAFLAKILPFISFETLILYMPAVVSPLLAVPVILIGRVLGSAAMGFFAALISVIAHSYYNRTTIGYYDDDMLTIVLPTLVLYFLLAGAVTKKDRYLILSAISAGISIWYYSNSQLIIFGIAGVLAIYSVIKRDFENIKLLAFLMAGIFFIHFTPVFAPESQVLAAAAICAVIFAAYMRLANKINKKIILAAFMISCAGALYYSNVFSHFWWMLQTYIVRDQTSASGGGLTLNFFNVAQTVREAGEIPFGEFANRISGHEISFYLACAGTAALIFAYPIFAISLPFIIMGFMAYGIPGFISGGGLRFTIYAVPVMALGLSFLFVKINDRFMGAFGAVSVNKTGNLNAAGKINNLAGLSIARYKAIAFLFTCAALYPNIEHIKQYLVPSVFSKTEVLAISNLKEIIEKRKDYAISWWDYGYPFRYYSYAKTLADGAKHGGSDNYAPSFILSADNQRAAANMSRLAVEYTEKQIADKNYSKPILAMMMSDYNFTDPNKFTRSLNSEINLPEKTREIYIILPYRMSQIFITVMSFSSLDLSSGAITSGRFFTAGNILENNGKTLRLSNGIIINAAEGTFTLRGQKAKIRQEFLTGHNADGQFFKHSGMIRGDGAYYLIFMRDLGEVWIADPKTFNSLFVQLFALENFDNELFEKISSNPLIKIYKAKI